MSHLGQRISALIDGELSDSERDRVLAHIAGCDPCRQEAVALRALKQRMHSLGEAMVDAALTGRLMAMAMPPDGRPWTARPSWRPRTGFPAARLLTAGVLASAVAGLGAAAFFAGAEPQAPDPRVTPAVDTFLVQHAIVTGDLPVMPASGTAGTSSSTAPGTGVSAVPVGAAATGVAAAAALGTRSRGVRPALRHESASSGSASSGSASSRSASSRSASSRSARGRLVSGQSASGQAARTVRLGLQQPAPRAATPVPAATAAATVSAAASPGP